MSATNSSLRTKAKKPSTLIGWGKDLIGYDEQVADVDTPNPLRDAFKDVPGKAVAYLQTLFPFTKWILHYNVTW
jgi:hypothetical protein